MPSDRATRVTGATSADGRFVGDGAGYREWRSTAAATIRRWIGWPRATRSGGRRSRGRRPCRVLDLDGAGGRCRRDADHRHRDRHGHPRHRRGRALAVAVRATGVDASGAMLEMARQRADTRLSARDRPRYRTAVGFADSLPYADGSFDLAMSSFVLQLVPSRAAALREANRVLRPGSTFAWVAWLRGGGKFAGDVIANEVLDAAGFDPPEADGRNGDLVSVRAAAAAMRRAGFQNVLASEGSSSTPGTRRATSASSPSSTRSRSSGTSRTPSTTTSPAGSASGSTGSAPTR